MKRKFDWVIDPTADRPNSTWDVELMGTRSFAVVPSLGALVAGWTLVVPRRSMLNFTELTSHERSELDALLMSLHDRLSKPDHQVFEFEHGSIHAGSVMGCGVDQAHLHVVPLAFDLLDAARNSAAQQIQWLDTTDDNNPWSSIPSLREYILLRQSRRVLVGLTDSPTSQWVRKVIARQIGDPDNWDYKHHPELANILETKRMVAL